jgi:hypothetical protein
MAALRFLRAARTDAALHERVALLDPADGLEPVLELASEAGFHFSVDELRRAHAHDWALRLARYASATDRPRATTATSEASTVAVVNTASSST